MREKRKYKERPRENSNLRPMESATSSKTLIVSHNFSAKPKPLLLYEAPPPGAIARRMQYRIDNYAAQPQRGVPTAACVNRCHRCHHHPTAAETKPFPKRSPIMTLRLKRNFNFVRAIRVQQTSSQRRQQSSSRREHKLAPFLVKAPICPFPGAVSRRPPKSSKTRSLQNHLRQFGVSLRGEAPLTHDRAQA